MKRLPWILVSFAIAIMLTLVALVSIPLPQQLTAQADEMPLTFQVDRRFVAFPGDCVYASWAVESIAGIFVNGRPTVGSASEQVCLQDRQAVYWDIEFWNETRQTYSLPVIIITQNPLMLLILGAAIISGFVGVFWLGVRYVPGLLAALNRRNILATAGLMLFGLTLALLLAEGLFRVWLVTTGTEEQRIRYLYNIDRIDSASLLYIGMPYLNFGMNPQAEGINERGTRGELAEVPKPSGVYRIVALGGSTTYGANVTTAEAYPSQLEAVLRFEQGYDNVEVINLGTPAYQTLDSVVNLAMRGIDYEPDLVIVYHGVNDAVIRLRASSACYQGDTPLRGIGWDVGIWQYSREDLPPSTLYRWLALQQGWISNPAGLLDRLEPTNLCNMQSTTPVPERLTENPPIYFERNLRSIIGLAQAHDAAVYLPTFDWNNEGNLSATIPPGSSVGEVSNFLKAAMTEHNEIIRGLWETDTNVYGFEFTDMMPDGAVYWQEDGYHMTPEGLAIQARIFAANLEEQGIIPR